MKNKQDAIAFLSLIMVAVVAIAFLCFFACGDTFEVRSFYSTKASLEDNSTPEQLERCEDIKKVIRTTFADGTTLVDDYLEVYQQSGTGYHAEYHYLLEDEDGSKTVKILSCDDQLALCTAAYYYGLIEEFPDIYRNEDILSITPEDATNYENVTYAFVWEGSSKSSD